MECGCRGVHVWGWGCECRGVHVGGWGCGCRGVHVWGWECGCRGVHVWGWGCGCAWRGVHVCVCVERTEYECVLVQGQTSGIESEAASSEFQETVSAGRSSPSSAVATGSSEQSGKAGEAVQGKMAKERGGEREGEREGRMVARTDSGMGKEEEWVAVQRKKKSSRLEGRVSRWQGMQEEGSGG